ncbi:MAG: hypothetical protein J6R22_02990 [Alphaproteobacteria bacterium]|nr:hypothetical protein [Alphaproteobacteria bacterium]
MNKELRIQLLALQPTFIKYLESLRNKNPLKGSDGGKNANSVFVEIGKNLIVDQILADIQEAKNPRTPSLEVKDGSEIMLFKVSE